ncbi:MAG: YczE/YyaS/YitT family protein [Actinomycetota bacterium]
MKDAPLLRGNLPVRLAALFGGLVLFGLAIVFMLESRLGLPPWDVLHLGIAKHTPLSLGVSGIAVGLIIVAATWLAGTPPGFGTVANAIVIGVSIDVLRSFDAIDGLSDSALAVRITLLAAGVLLFGVGSAFYISAGMGAGPRDSLMMALSKGTGRRIGLVRGVMEITVLLTGLSLGGIAGIGTLALALMVGPVVELAFWSLVKLRLATPGRLDALEFGPLDAA